MTSHEQEVALKRIIGGKTFNTETSAIVASDMLWHENDDGSFDFTSQPYGEWALYQTRHGAFFLWEGVWNSRTGKQDEYITPYDDVESREWLEKRLPEDPELIEQHFGQQPEAGDTESRITLRVPDVVKRRIDNVRGDLSMNAYILRCLEQCLAPQVVSFETHSKKG